MIQVAIQVGARAVAVEVPVSGPKLLCYNLWLLPTNLLSSRSRLRGKAGGPCLQGTFGQWIRYRRRQLDLTQKELADRVGCSPVTIRKLEADERRASKQFIERLAQCLLISGQEHERFLAAARTPLGFYIDGGQAESGERSRLLPAASGRTQVDWGEAPDLRRFYGRSQELVQLRSWLVFEGCRLIVILGMGGIGKTSLATKVAQDVQGQFEIVIWRSLRNAPPAEEILDDILRVLDPGATLDLVPNLDRQIKLLLGHLRRQRCLILLDNFEAILAEDARAGTYRVGYAGYGELLRRVCESNHHSCLLVTSRENPIEYGAQAGADAPLRVLRLSSLAPDDSRALLADRGLAGQDENWTSLSARYSGNPLVLQVMAEVIRELFQGNIDSFMRYDTTFFGGVRELLAVQFARLTPLEQGVLIWLAVHRETVELEMLHNDFEPAPGWTALLDALQSLRRRSLVEQSEHGFALQNVILEFVTGYVVEQVVREVSAQQPVLLQRYALLQARARQYVRDSQARLLIQPIVDELVASLGKPGAEARLSAVLAGLRRGQVDFRAYAAGNVLNLLVHLNGHLRGQDFSGLAVRQANLQGVDAQDTSFRAAQLDKCDFTTAFRSVQSVNFSSSGDYLVIGSDTGVYCVGDVEDIHSGHRYLEGSSQTWSACFSPDNTLLAAAGNDCTIRIWDKASGRCLHAIVGHTGAVFSVCFSPDGSHVLSGGADGAIRIWSVQNGACMTTLLGHTQGVRGLCFSPSGELLASAGEDGTVRLWENRGLPQAVHCVRTLQEQGAMVWSVAFSPDGAYVAAGGQDRTVRLWDADSGRAVMTLTGHTHYVTQICFNPDGTQLASASYDSTVRIWDTTSGMCVRTLQGHSSRVWSVAYSPTGSLLASGSSDQSVRLWDVDPASGSGRCIRSTRSYSNSTRCVAFSPAGTLLASCGQDRLVRLWDLHTGGCLATLRGHMNEIWHVGFSPNGQLLVSAGHDQIIRLWDVVSGVCVHEIETKQGCDDMSFHPTGAMLASANHDSTIDVWDVHGWRRIATLRGHMGEVWAVSFSPDGRLLASGSMDNDVRLWDWNTGACLCICKGHTSYVRVISFNPDGTVLASAGFDTTVRLWDVASAEGGSHERAILTGPGNAAHMCVAFSPDGNLLASGTVDGTVYIWDVTGALAGAPPLYALQGHTAQVFSVAFRPDGRVLASSGDDGTIRLWNVGDEPSSTACVSVLHVERPYERMNIAGVTGLTQDQVMVLKTLGAVET